MTDWTVDAGVDHTYKVRMVEPLLARSQSALSEFGKRPGRRLVLLDNGAAPHWEAPVRECLASLDIDAEVMHLRGGEAAKSLEATASVLERFQAFGVDRRAEPVIVIGGGAVLDVGGFAASIYRRGVPYLRVPTTLLAYVDASIGVKTGINFGRRKNLVGTFAPPALVLLDRAFFSSLPQREITSGIGELIKLAVGCDGTLFDALGSLAATGGTSFANGAAELAILRRAVDTTLRALGGNMYEAELCRALDLGHTFSQAFEMWGGADAIRHGEAVAWDVNLSAILAVRRGLIRDAEARRIADVTSRLGLPVQVPDVGVAELWSSVRERAQHRAGRQRTPLPIAIGRCTFVDDLSPAEVATAFERLKDGYLQSSGRHEASCPSLHHGAVPSGRSPTRS